MNTEPWIYESPDGGRTIYARQGSGPKHLLPSSESKAASGDNQLRKWYLWREILSNEDATIQHMLDQVEIYHHLKSQP